VTRAHSTWGLEPDSATLRTVGGHFATGVTVVTALDGDTPVGMACNSFTTVSLDPPLVLFCAMKSSSTWPRMEHAEGFALNVLSEDDEALCRVFATKDVDRFAAVTHRRGATGAPILDDALAYFDCVPEAHYDAGDHVIVVLRVVELGYSSEGKPLLFYRGGYGHFES
jgi:3-hydroxy-9,10-secoandrosta-1,3,5(10)-triene-9,17-dione monooxygenase reductase component